MMMKQQKREGAIAVEAAIVLPLFLLLMVMCLDIFRLTHAQRSDTAR